MTLFLVNMFNHTETGQRSLEDVVGIMGKQLRALGHQIVWDPKNKYFIPGEAGVNIIVEGFTDPVVGVIAQAHSEGARFVILATEEPGPKGFNQGTQEEMVRRQEVFPHAAKYAEGILHLVPGEHVTRWYAQFAPTAQAELGYAPELVRGDDTIEPDFDFGFYGSLTKRRLKLLKKLANATRSERAVKIVADFKTQAERDREMRRAKVIVQIRKFEEMGLVSSSRCNTALCIGRPVIAEPHLLSHPWDEIVRFAKTETGFIDAALMVRASWRGVHAAQFEKFKTKLSPEHCIGKPLRDIGILGDEPLMRAAG